MCFFLEVSITHSQHADLRALFQRLERTSYKQLQGHLFRFGTLVISDDRLVQWRSRELQGRKHPPTAAPPAGST